jgi:uncharacterized RDD family membrane protein YckC
MEKPRITEIKYTKKIIKKQRNAQGQLVNVESEYTGFMDVPTVNSWARFGHYLLDTVFYYIFTFLLAIPILIVAMMLGANADDIDRSDILMRLANWLIFYPAYYILFECTMGSTPAKLILGRVVVNEYGEKPNFISIVKRSYSRIVPFEAFSCLGDRGWHDNWSDTWVIRKTDLYQLKLAMQINEVGT